MLYNLTKKPPQTFYKIYYKKRVGFSLWVVKRFVNSVPLSVWIHSMVQGKAFPQTEGKNRCCVLQTPPQNASGSIHQWPCTGRTIFRLRYCFSSRRKDKFYIHLKAGIVHFFVGLWNILWIGRGNSHNALFFEETVSLGMGRGITTLAEFAPKDAGVSIASAHIPYQFALLRCIWIGMMVRASGFVPEPS